MSDIGSNLINNTINNVGEIYTDSNIKRLINNIIEQQKQEYSLNFDYHIVGKVSYYSSQIFNDKFKKISDGEIKPSYVLKSIKEALSAISLPFTKTAFYSTDDYILHFVNDKYIPILCKPDLTQIISTTYHEIYHAIDQSERNKHFSDPNNNSYSDFVDFSSILESYLAFNDPKYKMKYRTNHDDFMFEITANLYSAKKTREFIEKCNGVYKTDKTTYNLDLMNTKLCEKYFTNKLLNYDLTGLLNDVISNHKGIWANMDNQFTFFLNNNGTPKEINSILASDNLFKIDDKIFNSFLRTDTFKNYIEKLSNEKGITSDQCISEICSKAKKIKEIQKEKTRLSEARAILHQQGSVYHQQLSSGISMNVASVEMQELQSQGIRR